MSLTDREKEIALEMLEAYRRGSINHFEMFDLFLSRIRKEQKPNGYKSISGHCAASLVSFKLVRDVGPFIPLFTTPPAYPDCTELVDALEESNSLLVKILLGETDLKEIEEQAHDNRTVLANHAKRMKGEK